MLPVLVACFRIAEKQREGLFQRRLDPLRALQVARIQIGGNVFKIGVGLPREAHPV